MGCEMVRVCVVGVGYVGRIHAEKIKGMDCVDLVGVCDIIEERAEEIAKNLSTKPFYNYKDLLDKVDAAILATPTESHYKIAKDFLLAKKDVFVEKPLTKDLIEAKELVEIAKKKDLILQVGHLERFNPAFLKFLEFSDIPLFIESHRLSSFKARSTDIDVVMDLMIHDLDIILSLCGEEPSFLDAVGVPVITKKIDIANARLSFPKGCVANVTASRISDKEMRKIRIFQKDAYFSLDYLEQSLYGYRKKEKDGVVIEPLNFQIQKKDIIFSELLSFVHSVKDRLPPKVSGEDGLLALKVAKLITDDIAKKMRV